jgi:hypothetical protein
MDGWWSVRWMGVAGVRGRYATETLHEAVVLE